MQHPGLPCQSLDDKTSVGLVPKPSGFPSVKCVTSRSERVSTTCSKPQVPPSAVGSINGGPHSRTPHSANLPWRQGPCVSAPCASLSVAFAWEIVDAQWIFLERITEEPQEHVLDMGRCLTIDISKLSKVSSETFYLNVRKWVIYSWELFRENELFIVENELFIVENFLKVWFLSYSIFFSF